MTFRFDADTHTYTLDGRRLVHITELLAPMLPSAFFTEEGRDRGSLVHEAIETLHQRHQPPVVPPSIRGYLDAWESFCGAYQYEPLLFEEPLYHPLHLFAGTPDQYGIARKVETVLDIKTGAAHPAHALQTAAQAELIKANDIGKPRQRLSVYLRDDGNYSVHKHTEAGDWNVFLALLSIHRWKKRHGIEA